MFPALIEEQESSLFLFFYFILSPPLFLHGRKGLHPFSSLIVISRSLVHVSPTWMRPLNVPIARAQNAPP